MSCTSLVILPLLPILGKLDAKGPEGRQNFLNTLTSFAVGGLLGDVFLHIIPHSIGGGHEPERYLARLLKYGRL